MQIFVRCGEPVSTVAVTCTENDTVAEVKWKLAKASNFVGQPGDMRLIYGSRQLEDGQNIVTIAGGQAWCTMQLSMRLRGGGGDGGSTGAESRSCYLEMYKTKKADKVNPAEELLAKWTRCHLSGEPLTPPCVVDELGYLYNKDAVVHALLLKQVPESLPHISALKHVVEIKLEPNSRKAGSSVRISTQDSFQPNNDAEFCCPVTGLEFNGRFKFVVHKQTGLVVSERAVKEVPAVVEDLFHGKWSPDDLIHVNPVGEQLDLQKSRVASRMTLEAEKKAAKKGKKGKDVGDAASHAIAADGNGTSVSGKRGGSPDAADGPADSANAAKKVKVIPGFASISEDVYKSIFINKNAPQQKETFACRSVAASGMRLT